MEAGDFRAHGLGGFVEHFQRPIGFAQGVGGLLRSLAQLLHRLTDLLGPLGLLLDALADHFELGRQALDLLNHHFDLITDPHNVFDIVNMQQAEATLGQSEDVTLTDMIHIISIAYILASSLLAMLAYLRCEAGREDFAQQMDRKIYLPIFMTSFVVVNAVVIAYAAIIG